MRAAFQAPSKKSKQEIWKRKQIEAIKKNILERNWIQLLTHSRGKNHILGKPKAKQKNSTHSYPEQQIYMKIITSIEEEGEKK